MKKLYTFLLLIASIAVLFSSCVKEEKHQAGEADVEGCYGVYFPAQDGSIALDPADPTVATIKVARNNTTGAITVPVEFTEPDGIVTAGDITFDDGQGETTCKLTFDNAEVGVVYTCKFVISDPQYASKYSKQPIAFDYKISRDKWNSLGKAKFTDSFVFENTYEAELIQNDKNKNVFRLLDPYTEGLKAEEYYPDNVKAGPTPYIEFRILKQGESIYKDGSAKVTQKDLVYFINYRTGFYHTTYNNEVNAFFPGTFTKYSDETGWMYNRVLQYQDTGLPAGVQLAPYYYIEGVGGWDESQKNGTITIVFPGAVLTDFSLKLEAGQSDEGELPVDFTLGTDVKEAKYAIYEGALNSAQVKQRVDKIADGTEKNIKSVTESGVQAITLAKTGVYTLVAVTFDAANKAQETETVEFSYVAADDEVPVVFNCGLTSTNKFEPLGHNSDEALEYYVFGKELKEVRVGLYMLADVMSNTKGCVADLLDQDPVDAETLAKINDKGFSGAFFDLTPGTEYGLIVIASNGYETSAKLASAKTTGKLDVKLSDVVGSYSSIYTSYFDNKQYKAAFVIEESDDAEKGQIMFKKFLDLDCTSPVYANLDLENNKIIVPDYQLIQTNEKIGGDLYFVTYDGTPATIFSITNIGKFGSPSGMFGIHIIGGANDNKTFEAVIALNATKDAAKSQFFAAPSFAPRPTVNTSAVNKLFNSYKPVSNIETTYEPQTVDFTSQPSQVRVRNFQREVQNFVELR